MIGGGAMMKKLWETVVVLLLLLLLLPFTPHAEGTRYSPPGKPALTRCRSPDKETFTCWWEPSSDGGLPTTYALYYRKENSEALYECPDYLTAGENSCFFNKNDTSIWVNYNITVVATNALGRTFSDPVDIDVVYIVEPNPPEELNVTVVEDKGWPYLRVSWKPPHKADTRSGWITLIYELRVRLEGEDDWEMHLAGQQKIFNIFSLQSGGRYQVQVRCKPDHGFWSEWSSTAYIKVPDYFHRDKSMWILITVFSTFIFLIFIWVLHTNSNSLKYCILPPIPGPKIKGFDKQLLKSGKSNEIFSALVVPDFPPTTSPNFENLVVEYLEVYVPEEQELMLEEGKELHNSLKCEGSTSDNDSGRGSCDSHTLLMDKCGGAKGEESPTDDEGSPMEMEAQIRPSDLNEGTLSNANQDSVSPDMSSGRVKTWPSVFSPLPQYCSSPLDQMNSLAMAKQHCLSDKLLPPDSASSFLTQPGSNTTGTQGPNYFQFYMSNEQFCSLKPQAHTPRKLHSDTNISNISHKQAGLPLPDLQPTVYVEVQRVNMEDMVLLQPVESSYVCGNGCLHVCKEEDYSKVKGVNSDNMLLLHRDVMEGEEVMCQCEKQETDGATVCCTTSPIITATQKPTDCIPTVTPVQKEMGLAVSGYVDTAAMFTLPTF